MYVKNLKNELAAIEEGLEYMYLTDTTYCREYAILRRRRRIIKRAIRILKKLEENR